MILRSPLKYTVKNNVPHLRVVVLSVKSALHDIDLFQILSAIILQSTKVAFLGS